ncbi:MAG TPA: rhomboid family intramembrane serine protease [Roseiarcus sp.]|nr:rhomboid family intramembrane serine protease [Roseiarcus sp.]
MTATDETPRGKRREPIFDIPFVIVALTVLLLAIYLVESQLSDAAIDVLLERLAFVPGHLTVAICPQAFLKLQLHAGDSAIASAEAHAARAFLHARGLVDLARAQGACSLSPANFARVSIGDLATMVTYAFLHLNWAHVGLNSLWIVAFGPPVARRFGAARFLVFFLAAAVAGALAHWVFNPLDFAPLAGASASDSGLMGAAARFIFEPEGPLGGGGFSRSSPRASHAIAAPPLRKLLRDRRVVIFLGVWLVGNFVFGAGAETLGLSDQPVAWLAHVGGFALGFFAFPLFDPRTARATQRP